MPKATTPPDSPNLFIVKESFLAEENGAPVVYIKGEVVHPDDPYLKETPERFEPFAFRHPVRRARTAVTLGQPEVRAD